MWRKTDTPRGWLTPAATMRSGMNRVARDVWCYTDTVNSKDILSRWTFPLVPDDNHPGGHSYEHLRGNKYIAKGNSVVLSRSVCTLLPGITSQSLTHSSQRTCKIGNNTLIGAHTTIEANASVHSSVIGQRCTIGAGAVLRDAYIFDDTHIGAGCVVEGTIIGERVRIGDRCRIPRGCLIAEGVVIGDNAKLRRFERVSKKRDAEEAVGDEDADDEDEEEEDSDLEEVEARMCTLFERHGVNLTELFETDQEGVEEIVGKGSNALVWPRGAPEEDETLDEREQYNNQRLMRMCTFPVHSVIECY